MVRHSNVFIFVILFFFSEFAINTTELYKPRYIQLPKPVSIKRGDVLAFYVKSKAVIVSANQNGSYILTYCGQIFSSGGEVMVLNATKQNDTSLWFRAHVAVPVVLEMPIEPKLPSVQLGFTVSSVLGHKEVKECTIEVQVYVLKFIIFILISVQLNMQPFGILHICDVLYKTKCNIFS